MLAAKVLFRHYLLPSSSLWSLLASENLANNSWKFSVLVYSQLLDAGIVNFNVLEFKFTGALLWTFLPARIFFFLFLSNVVESSHFPSELRYSALEHARVTLRLFPSTLMGCSLVRVLFCVAVFHDFDVFISLSLVVSISTAESYAIFVSFSLISFHDSNNFVMYSDSRSALQALGSFIHAIP